MGLRGRRRAADRLNLIRVMPAQGGERSAARDESLEPVAKTEPTSENVDVLVVGAGVIGLSCAWRAASRGMSVKVIERDRPGAGASGVAAGMLAPVGEASWGEDRLLGLTLASHRAWPRYAGELAEASGRDVGLLALGALHVALDRDEAADLRRRFELMRAHGLDAEWLAPSACRELEPGLAGGGHGGVHAPHEAAVDPRLLLAALEAALENAGGALEIAEVRESILDGDRVVGVVTADGVEHRAATTVVAAGAWAAADWVPEPARLPLRPVKGQILTLRGPASRPVCGRIVAGERFYAVPRSDGRLVLGATVEELGFDLRVTAGAVHELLREGYRASARDRGAGAGRGDGGAASGDARQRAGGRGDARRAGRGDRALPQRDPARAADGRSRHRGAGRSGGMTIELNGERVEIAATTTVAALVERTGAEPSQRGIAVAVNGEVVPRSAWGDTPIRDGQRIEVLGAIQGG